MNTSPLRFVLALAVGSFVTYCVFIFLSSYTPWIFSYEAMPELMSQDAYIAYIQELPLRAVVALVLTCILGAFSGGYTASRIAKNRKQDVAIAVGIVWMVILVFLAVAFSFPLLLAAGIIVVQIPFAFLGGRVAGF